MGYNFPSQQYPFPSFSNRLPPAIHRSQFNSMDNILTDSLPSEPRTSFSLRNPVMVPLHHIPSASTIPMTREFSCSADWGQSSLQFDIHGESDKDEADHPKRVESPPFYSNYLHPGHSPIPFVKEGIEGRKSNLSELSAMDRMVG